MHTSIRDLQTKGFVSLPYPQKLREAVEQTLDAWKAFTALSVEAKKGLPYSNSADGVGYELKDGNGPSADRKENFDVTVAGRHWLKRNAEKFDNLVALDFVQRATALAPIMKPLILESAMDAEEAFGIKGLAKEVDESEDTFFVRFIHYFGGRSRGVQTASAHIDQSGFTLHLYESAKGLQCLSYAGKWLDMPVSVGETVIIPAMQLQLRSEGKLRALTHRVVATTDTARTGRFSAVCFVQLKHTPKYDKDAHGRLQEREPGFNYHLSQEEFRSLFKR